MVDFYDFAIICSPSLLLPIPKNNSQAFPSLSIVFYYKSRSGSHDQITFSDRLNGILSDLGMFCRE